MDFCRGSRCSWDSWSGTKNPNSLFGNHQVVLIGDATIYDPSYGKKFDGVSTNVTLLKLDNESIEAFAVIDGMVPPPDGKYRWLIRKNPAGIDIWMEKKPYSGKP